jgi:hypothetical protein
VEALDQFRGRGLVAAAQQRRAGDHLAVAPRDQQPEVISERRRGAGEEVGVVALGRGVARQHLADQLPQHRR